MCQHFPIVLRANLIFPFRARRFFYICSSFYNTLTRAALEYRSHKRDEASFTSISLSLALSSWLGSTKGLVRLIIEACLISILRSLAYRENFASLILSYRCHSGFCLSELAPIVLPMTCSRSYRIQEVSHFIRSFFLDVELLYFNLFLFSGLQSNRTLVFPTTCSLCFWNQSQQTVSYRDVSRSHSPFTVDLLTTRLTLVAVDQFA